MSLRDVLLVIAGGLVAGAANTIAGGGSLLSFPLLVVLGLPPLAANVTNTVGIVPAAVGGAIGFRSELVAQKGRLLGLLPFAGVGAIGGGVLLLTTPARAFSQVVPLLIVLACAMLLLQRRIADSLVGRQGRQAWLLRAGTFATGVYGGYFGAAVSVLILALMAVTIADTLPRLNALKVPLAGTMNLVSGIVFAFLAPVHWGYVLVLAPSTLVGGRVGAALARHIPAQVLRVVVVVLGLGAAAWLEFSQ
ncbi:MAG TPA: sulfite exporter TauE/SafE family protein [Candidatus Dormibacteraeota bacterium]|nr:sulfite exporter TauE/SafE family protein [Candidatus Dormibacteraeota bacterium]